MLIFRLYTQKQVIYCDIIIYFIKIFLKCSQFRREDCVVFDRSAIIDG